MTTHLHPRPQLRRTKWKSLNGSWQFSRAKATDPADVEWQCGIHVPYPPESPMSGVDLDSPCAEVWYRRTFEVEDEWFGERVLLHFNAVDYECQVWVNGHSVATHIGGHTPFQVDITHFLVAGREQELIVQAKDDPREMDKPRGKQDWLERPHSIWYPQTTGIWQEVWLEPVPHTRISKLRLTPRLQDFSLEVEACAEGVEESLTVEVVLRLGEDRLTSDKWSLQGRRGRRRIHLADPGIDDARERFLWSPERPNLIDLEVILRADGREIDRVESYAGLRSVETRSGRFFLNGRPYFLRMVLDQGYWPESHMTPPNEESLKHDVELAKGMGFNGVRKHQKVEDPRYLYWADKLGLLVWTEMPSAYSFSPEMVDRVTREWLDVLERDYNHPSVVAWVLFNESWGVPDLPVSPRQRHLVEGLYHLTKALDPSRPAVGNDGWEHVTGDLLTVHDYEPRAELLAERYCDREAVERTVDRHFPNGRTLSLGLAAQRDLPVVLSEFGGIRLGREAEGWGYTEARTADELLERYSRLISAASGTGLSGFCYTQFADTFQEQNGLLYSDRTPKIALGLIADATRQVGSRRGADP